MQNPASIPIGTYLKSMQAEQFWFQKMRFDGMPPLVYDSEQDDSQRTLRLGYSGGFAATYFNTINFLSAYRSNRYDDYRDLLITAAALSSIGAPATSLVEQLQLHRRQYANISPSPIPIWRASPLLRPTDDQYAVLSPPRPDIVQALSDADIVPNNIMTENVTKLSTHSISLAYAAAIQDAEVNRDTNSRIRPFYETPTIREITPEDFAGLDELVNASEILQLTINKAYLDINPSLETNEYFIDLNPVLAPADPGQALRWLVLRADTLSYAYAKGALRGKLSALAYVAMVEANRLVGDKVAIEESAASEANLVIGRVEEAERLLKGFGRDDFLNYGTDGGAFKGCLRMRLVHALELSDGSRKTISATTPFLPLTSSTERLSDKEKTAYLGEHVNAVSDMQEYYKNVSNWLFDAPKVTASLPQGAIFGCKSVFRHASRTLFEIGSAIPEIRDARLLGVMMIPEVTNPWTYAGVGNALMQTLIVALEPSKLATTTEREKVKAAILASVTDMIDRNVYGVGGDLITKGSVVSPSAAAYTHGYRVAYALTDRVCDGAAQAEGARLVYASLVEALPEFFPVLDPATNLTSDNIAVLVRTAADVVRSELEELRLRVRELTEQAMQYEEFLEELTDLLERLGQEMGTAESAAAVKDMQTRFGPEIQARLRSGITQSQKNALIAVQGVVLASVTVVTTVTANVTAQVRAEFNGNKGKQNGVVNK